MKVGILVESTDPKPREHRNRGKRIYFCDPDLSNQTSRYCVVGPVGSVYAADN